jgi:hypothetical protein
MGNADQESGPRAVADGEELDRPALGRGADRLQARDAGKLLDQRPGARPELRQRQELAEVGDPGEQPVKIDGLSYDSSFEE